MEIMITALTPDATDKVLALYRSAAAARGGLARTPDEIDERYVRGFLERAQKDGVSRAIWMSDGSLAAEIHAIRMTPRQFGHVLTDLTVAVHPDWQHKGFGTLLFKALTDAARAMDPRVTRIELMAREGNAGAIRLYQRAGFRIEGRFEARVRLPDGTIEDDIAMAMLL
jgi:putative acetyltransferase